MQSNKKSIVILDANAFISMMNIKELGIKNRLVTSSGVIEELKDAKTKAFFNEIPFEIEELNYNAKSLVFVKEFATKTGDIGSLSDIDMELLALAHTLHVQEGLQSKLKNEPMPLIEKEDLRDIAGDESLSDSEYYDQQETKQPIINQSIATNIQSKDKDGAQLQVAKNQKVSKQQDEDGWIVVKKKKKAVQQQAGSGSDDEQDWITPKNYNKKMAERNSIFKEQQAQLKEEQNFNISLVSSDFAIQNVAVQMGIHLLSLDARRIISIRRFIWQCYLCWKLFKITDNTIKLCTNCGYNSLSKIAFSIYGDGNMILHRKKGWKPNKKVLEWKERTLEEQERNKKHQHARRRKKPSIFDN